MGSIRGPDDNKRGRIVLMIVGSNIRRLQFRHMPSDWPLRSRACGLDVDREVERLRRAAIKACCEVEAGYAVEDWRRRPEGSLTRLLREQASLDD